MKLMAAFSKAKFSAGFGAYTLSSCTQHIFFQTLCFTEAYNYEVEQVEKPHH